MSDMKPWQRESFELLAHAIAQGVALGPREVLSVPPDVDAVIASFGTTRIQLLRAHDIQRDDYSYRCRVLKAEPK